uniref:CUB domain-containing protein n=1 Tax=Timema douglasi TaxID=61478 RepID=A0A7R8VKX5_TIMDO|nr:unnamed protein product [Timema douglasi]
MSVSASAGVCHGVYRTSEFRVTSPGHPGHYPANMLCSYTVEARSSATCQLEVTFNSFYLADCGQDYLEFGGEKLCGHLQGVRTFPFNSDTFTISFKSGSSCKGTGFDLKVRQIDCATRNFSQPQSTCSRIYSTQQFLIGSPEDMCRYPNNVYCVYVIRPSTTDVCELQFNFLEFSLEYSLGCVKDRLEVEGREVLCGNVTGIRRYQGFSGELVVRFISDSSTTAKGFKILVTQVPCGSMYEPSESTTQIYPVTPFPPMKIRFPILTSTPSSYLYPGSNYSPSSNTNLPTCCGKAYSDKFFFIASPGFPNSSSLNSDCIYTIQRSSSSICRLRMKMKYFWVGDGDRYSGCNGGYLEVDGQQICGCQSDTVLTTTFSLNQQTKVLRYTMNGSQQQNLRGFIIEVLQEKCFSSIWGGGDNSATNSNSNSWSFMGKDLGSVFRNVAGKKFIRKRRSPQEINEADANFDSTYKPIFYQELENSPKEMRNSDEYLEDSYIDDATRVKPYFGRSDIMTDPVIRPRRSLFQNNNKCWKWNFSNWVRMAKQFLWSIPGQMLCPTPKTTTCQVISAVQGSIQSPNYPNSYPANLRCSYRFQKISSYCQVQLTMAVFNLAVSNNCTSDYILINGFYRYCGDYFPTPAILDLSSSGFSDLLFVTSQTSSGRGFVASYQYLPCSSSGGPTTGMCSTSVQAQYFNLSSTNYNLALSACTFRVLKAYQVGTTKPAPSVMFNFGRVLYVFLVLYRSALAKGACEVQLSLQYFNLTCGEESLQIGSQYLCGYLTGQFISAQFDSLTSEVQLVYRKSSAGSPGSFIITGQQVTNCSPFSLKTCPCDSGYSLPLSFWLQLVLVILVRNARDDHRRASTT